MPKWRADLLVALIGLCHPPWSHDCSCQFANEVTGSRSISLIAPAATSRSSALAQFLLLLTFVCRQHL